MLLGGNWLIWPGPGRAVSISSCGGESVSEGMYLQGIQGSDLVHLDVGYVCGGVVGVEDPLI